MAGWPLTSAELLKFRELRILGSGVPEKRWWFFLYQGSSEIGPLLSFPLLKGKFLRPVRSSSWLETVDKGLVWPREGSWNSNQLYDRSDSLYRKGKTEAREQTAGYSLPVNCLQLNQRLGCRASCHQPNPGTVRKHPTGLISENQCRYSVFNFQN